MSCFTVSGLFRSACLLMYVNTLSTNLMLVSALPLFFICMRMFKMAGLQLFID